MTIPPKPTTPPASAGETQPEPEHARPETTPDPRDPVGEWWGQVYAETADTFGARNHPDPDQQTVVVEKTDGEDQDPDHADTGDGKPKKRKKRNGKVEKADPADEPDTDQVEDDPDTAAARALRHIKALRSLEHLDARRWVAAKYMTGAALGWGFGLDDYVRAYLFATHADPGGGLSTAFTVAALPGAFVGLAKLTGRLRFPDWLSWVVILGGTSYAVAVANGYGYAAVGYMTAHGWDAATLAPLAIGCALPLASWWVIDQRTQRWAVHWPGRVLHWSLCAVTGSALLALALYLPNA